SSRDGNREVYRMRPDGSEQQNLTTHRRVDELPRWLPDGRRIVFYSGRDRSPQLYQMAVDGTQLKKVPPALREVYRGEFGPIIELGWSPGWLILLGLAGIGFTMFRLR
ncbi:MAG: hypothetical protein K8I82_10015, partial [Anaerolineae bacterium]|nr:hypothetical protein [Anaerolineae bacterium]